MTKPLRALAFVLDTKSSGESNRSIQLLAREGGLRWVSHFGGAKSKLRGMAAPFHRGMAWIAEDQAKGFARLTDFEPDRYYPSFRESLEKHFAASLMAEVAIRTHLAGGEVEAQFDLLSDAFDSLDASGDQAIGLVVAQYLARELRLSGSGLDHDACARCGRGLAEGAGYSGGHGLHCLSCEPAPRYPVDRAATRYLGTSLGMGFREALRLAPPAESLRGLKEALLAMTQALCGAELKSLKAWEAL
jgi:recombinational DNA repair protein (RecF pathway)